MSDGPGWTPPVEPPGGWDAPGGSPGTPGTPGTPEGSGGYPVQPPGYGGGYGGGHGQPGQPPAWGTQNTPWGAPPATRPGVIPLRPLGVGEILDGAFTVMRHYPKVTLGLSAIVVSATTVLQIGIFALVLLGQNVTFDQFVGRAVSALAVGVILGAVTNSILAGMLTSVMGEAVLGRPTTIGATWARVRPRFWALLVASLVAGLAPFLALFLCVVPGVFLWGAWALVTPALILERAGVGQAIRRSWRLAVPDWWRVWGIRALGALVAAFLGGIISYPTQMLMNYLVADSDGSHLKVGIGLVVLFLGQTIATTITAPFGAGVLALLYIDRRMRAEGLDVTLAQAAAAEARF